MALYNNNISLYSHCYHFLSFLPAEPCSTWSLYAEDNVEKKCAKQGPTMTCTVHCKSGYTFSDGENIPHRFICTGGTWNPSSIAPACVPIAQEPARYELVVSINYSIQTPVGSDCLKVCLIIVFYFYL